jgi:hypothetical protein
MLTFAVHLLKTDSKNGLFAMRFAMAHDKHVSLPCVLRGRTAKYF